jgi:membrane protein YqaA with SNARE-associated domain
VKLFTKLYDLCLTWATHRHAEKYLGGLSFSESMIFPIPPDVMLAPMSLAQPSKAWRYALITTLASVLGGVAGYVLGWLAFDSLIQPLVTTMGWEIKLANAVTWFTEYGVWIVFIAGFSPIPYKVFTITAGMLSMAFLPFVIASFVGRGGRFFLVAGLMKWGGAKMEAKLRQYVEILGWAVILLAIAAYIIVKYT